MSISSGTVVPKGMIETVSDDLRKDLTGGRYKSGARLPTYRELARKYDVSVTSVQYAVKQLKTEGLLSAIRGSGTYVNHPVSRGREAQSVVKLVYRDVPSKRIVNNLFWMMLREFHDRHPEISLQFAPLPQGLIDKRDDLILSELFGKNGVSTVSFGHDFIRHPAYHRQIADISRPAASWEDAGNILDAAWDACRLDDCLFGIPFLTDIHFLLVYRPTLRRLLGSEANIEKCFSSWESVRELRASAAGKKTGLNILCNGAEQVFYLWQHLLVQRGIEPFEKKSPARPPLIGREGTEALSSIRDLLRTGTLQLVEQVNTAEFFSSFAGGKHPALFIHNDCYLLAMLRERGVPDRDIMLLPVPLVQGGRRTELLMTRAWVFSPYLSDEDLNSAVKLACYFSDPSVHDLYHKQLADVFPERRYWLPLGKNLNNWDRLTPEVQGPWKEYIKAWLPKATARPTSPLWTWGMFEKDLRSLAADPSLSVDRMLAAYRQESSPV